MPAMKLFIDWGEERRYVLMVDQTLLVGDLRERVANHFHALFPGEAPLVFFRMRDAEGYFLTDTSMLQDVVEDRTTVECFRGDDELEGRGPKPTCSISSLLKYCAPFALRDAMDGNVEAMNNIVSLIFLDDCSLVLEKMLENINDIKFVQLFIQQGGLFALLRRISSTASTQTASLQLSKKIWHALIRGPFGDQMEELLREVLAKEESGKGSKDEKLCEHNDNNAGILERMAQCPDETVAASGFFDAFFASPEGFERLWPIFLSSARSADLLAAHWSVASPPNGGNWDAVVVPSDVEAILRQALILQPQWIMRCLEDNCFTSAALQALKGMVDKVDDGRISNFVDSLPVRNLTCLLLQLASKVPQLLLPTMEVLGLLSIKDEYREFLLRETSFFDFLCASLYEHAVSIPEVAGEVDSATRGAIVREVAKCLVHLSADTKIKAAAKQSVTINQTFAKTKDPLVRHYLHILQT
eukprot:GEMP01053197.1.p1 GENE.GEMP01053197.1~~GEMP01053197.1.p1  ORF type:complete len:471 (+),score=107.85 GEMP01053197.1:105-1517(+)